MVASLNGVIFDQIYADNTQSATTAPEFDTDGDGTTTQEDEFVSFTNTTAAPVDISGWQIWSDSAGGNAPDAPQDGLFHTFPPGTVLAPGETLFVINEITGPTPYWAQEASEGGVESGAGGDSTNFLTEGSNDDAESIALVNPDTGEFLVFNMDDEESAFSEFDGGDTSDNANLAGFPGTIMVAEIDGHAVQDDTHAGASYQYNASSGGYQNSPTFVSCFGPDTWIDTPRGGRQITTLRRGDLVCTRDNGPQPVAHVLHSRVPLDDVCAHAIRPIALACGCLGAHIPDRTLTLSPQHRVLHILACGREVLSPAKGLLDRRGVRIKRGVKVADYYHLLLPRHEVIRANGLAVESLFLGDYGLRRMHPRLRHALERAHAHGHTHRPARPFVGPRALQRMAATAPWPAM